jgi:hypothetical protein
VGQCCFRQIALDLCEAGVEVALSVRSPVCVLPCDFLGIPIVNLAIAQRFLPAGLVDALNAPLLRLVAGSMESLGLKQADKGPVMRTMPTGPDAQGTWNGLADRRPGFRQAGGRAVARGAGMVIADTQKSDESARRQATRDRSLRGKDCAHAPISPPLRAIFPLELFASRQFDLVQAILRPSRPQSALPSC